MTVPEDNPADDEPCDHKGKGLYWCPHCKPSTLELQEMLAVAYQEIERLKRGEFTPEEWQVQYDTAPAEPVSDKEVRKIVSYVLSAERVGEIHKVLKGCVDCDLDEAEGELIDHCDVCCRKVTALVWEMLYR